VKTRTPVTVVIIPERISDECSPYTIETTAEISMKSPSITSTRLKTLAMILKLIIQIR
jgi:hypothetical protein